VVAALPPVRTLKMVVLPAFGRPMIPMRICSDYSRVGGGEQGTHAGEHGGKGAAPAKSKLRIGVEASAGLSLGIIG